jgi:hypothetical protein
MNNTPNRSGLNTRTILIGILVIAAAVIFLPRLFNTGDNTTVNESPLSPQTDNNQSLDPNVTLGRLVSASGVDRDGCPTDTRSTFEPTEPIYVIAEGSDMPQGTSVFVRLYREGQPIEDAPEITADRDYDNTCVNFVFEPTGSAFDPGQYEAEFIINGNQADTISFDVQ